MIKNCALCGKEFETYQKLQKYCSLECAHKGYHRNNAENARRYRKRIRDQKLAKAQDKPTKPLSEWVKEAAECNLDYGSYRTLIEMQGKTFEELKATAPSRTPPIHQRSQGSVRTGRAK